MSRDFQQTHEKMCIRDRLCGLWEMKVLMAAILKRHWSGQKHSIPQDWLNTKAPGIGIITWPISTIKYSAVDAFRLMIANKYYLMICGIYILQQLYTAMIGAGIFYATWVLKNKNLFGVFSWAVNIPLIIALIFTPTLVEMCIRDRSCIIRVLAITKVSTLSVFILRTLFLRMDEVMIGLRTHTLKSLQIRKRTRLSP